MSRAGFTLLEVVIAAAATAALTVTALAVLATATEHWTRLQRGATLRETAETTLDRMADDFQSGRLSSVTSSVELRVTLVGPDGSQIFQRRVWVPVIAP